MPQEHRIVNGRLVLVGSQRSSDLRPTPQPAGARPRPPRSGGSGRPSRPPKPWWQQVLNHAEYEVFGRPFQNPLVRYNPVAQLVRRNWQTQKFLLNQAALGVVGAGDNAARSGYEYVQRVSGRPRGDASSGRLGADLDRNVDRLYTMLGATPPSQMTPQEREFDQNRRSIALNVLLAPATPSLGAANAATGLGMLVRGAGAFGLNEALSTFLDDNRGGNPVNLINQLTGARLPGAVDVGKDDRLDAAIKSLAPNAAASLAFGAALGGGVALSARGIDAFRNIRRNIQADRAIAAELRHRARQRDLGLLEEDEAGGLDFTPDAQQPPAPAPAPASAPAATQAPDPRTPAQQTLDANAAMEQRLGMRPEAAPAAPEPKPIPTSEFQDPTQPGADMGAVYEPGQERPWDYDPSLPESTALGKSVEDLSDSEIQAVLSSPGTPVVERVNQAIEARAGVEPRPGMDAAMVMAPTGRLADDYISSVMRKLDAREPYELRSLFDPQVNPGLWQRAQALTGVDDVSQLSKADMLDAIRASAADGQTPIVNRLMGGQMLPTGEVAAAPQVFQYKGNVNAAGEQLGNSLEGVERWDPNAENIIQVWRDANGEIGNPGQVYVVNGHNRLAAANRLGIPSMRVEYLDAPTAAEARLQGAIANVSDGKGTVFDAAKLAREYGITDPAQLKAMGKPGASGFWKDGIALGKLPEDVFTAAVNGQLGETTRKAVIIGESGVDPETMRSAYRYLVQQGPDSVKEATLREMLAMAGRSPAASSADQPDLLTGTEWGQSFNEGLLAKANLAGTVRQLLGKEKKLFGTVGRQAGQIERVGQVDAAAAKDISGEASRALTIFDQLKYEAGPVGDLLNEGTQRILAGESADQVAKGIKNRLAAAISEAMGKEVAPVTDVVQEDMFAAAGRSADQAAAPVELSPEQRNAAEAQLLHEAIAGGEVRPPSAPIPDLPAPAQVRLDEIDMNAPITPGSKAAQALADEARLALEHARMDAAMQQVQEQAAKDGMGYEHLAFDQKREAGALGGGVGEVVTPEVLPPGGMPGESRTPIADALGENLRALAESDARMFREINGLLGDVKQTIDEMGGGRKPAGAGGTQPLPDSPAATPALAPAPAKPRPLRLMQPASQPELLLPQDLRRAAPRYGRNTIAFQSDLDRAAYVLANDAVKPSKAAAKFRQVVQEAGLSLDEVVAHGKRVKAALKQAAKGTTGEIDLPAQPWRGGGPAPAALAGDAEMAVDGWGSFDGTSVDAATRARRKEQLLEIVKTVAGSDVSVRFEDQYLKGVRQADWGGDGKETVLKAGFYRLREDLMVIRGIAAGSESELVQTAYHESFHRLQYLALGEKEAKVMDSLWARMKIAIGSNHVEGRPGTGKPIAYSESQAVAFQRYAEARQNGQDPVVAMLGGYEPGTSSLTKWTAHIVAAFDRIIDVGEKLYNRLALGTFDSAKGIFERARAGALAQATEYAFEEPGSGLIRMTASDGWRRRSWDGRAIPTKADITRAERQIADIDQQMADIRRKAEQEGC